MKVKDIEFCKQIEVSFRVFISLLIDAIGEVLKRNSSIRGLMIIRMNTDEGFCVRFSYSENGISFNECKIWIRG